MFSIRSDGRLLRLLAHRLAGNHLRRRQHRKLQAHDLANIASRSARPALAAIWQFGGYGQNNASNGAYQVGVGGDIPNLANGVLSVDAIYSYVRDSTAAAVAGGPTDVNGTPIPPFLQQALTLTISDNRAVMLLARYTNGPLNWYDGYEQIKYSAPSARGHVVAVTCLALEARIALGPGVSVICNHNSRLVASLEAAVKWRFGHHQFRQLPADWRPISLPATG